MLKVLLFSIFALSQSAMAGQHLSITVNPDLSITDSGLALVAKNGTTINIAGPWLRANIKLTNNANEDILITDHTYKFVDLNNTVVSMGNADFSPVLIEPGSSYQIDYYYSEIAPKPIPGAIQLSFVGQGKLTNKLYLTGYSGEVQL